MAHSVLLGLLAFLCAIFVDLQVKAVDNASKSTSHGTNSAVEQATDRISCAADNTTYTDTTSASSFALITFMLASLAQLVHHSTYDIVAGFAVSRTLSQARDQVQGRENVCDADTCTCTTCLVACLSAVLLSICWLRGIFVDFDLW